MLRQERASRRYAFSGGNGRKRAQIEIGIGRFRWAVVSKDGRSIGRADPSRRAGERARLGMGADIVSYAQRVVP
jgi:hypothetical protein